jgi:hypothetical protein
MECWRLAASDLDFHGDNNDDIDKGKSNNGECTFIPKTYGRFLKTSLRKGDNIYISTYQHILSLDTSKIEAICFSETSILLTRAKLRHIPEDNILNKK